MNAFTTTDLTIRLGVPLHLIRGAIRDGVLEPVRAGGRFVFLAPLDEIRAKLVDAGVIQESSILVPSASELPTL